ncbi:hypothetical protein TeGR_g7917, partial [Tetraparma gracilis]
FKTLAAYAQITTALSFNLELSFVDLAYFTGVMKYLNITINVFAVNFSWIMPMSCVITGTNFLTTTYGMCSTYLAIMAGLFTASKYFGRNPGLAAKAQDASSKAQELAEDAKNTMSVMQGGEHKYRVEGGGDEKKKTDLSAALFNNLLLFTFLILPGISTQIVNTFACTPLVDDDDIMNSEAEGWFLKSDYSVRCHYRGYFDVTNAYRHEDDIQQQVNNAHATAKWFAGLMVLIFPLGVPIMYYFLLWKERDQLDPGEAEMVGFKVAVEEVGGRVAEVAREKLEMIEGAYWGGFEEEWDADGDFGAAHATGMCAAVEALSAIGAEAKAAAERARGMDWKGKVGKALDEERRKLQEELKAMLVQSIKDECLGLKDELVEEAVEWLKGEAERAGLPFLFEDKIKAKVGGVLGDKIEIGVDFLCANFFNPKRI